MPYPSWGAGPGPCAPKARRATGWVMPGGLGKRERIVEKVVKAVRATHAARRSLGGRRVSAARPDRDGDRVGQLRHSGEVAGVAVGGVACSGGWRGASGEGTRPAAGRAGRECGI